jgi:hypothetical protein
LSYRPWCNQTVSDPGIKLRGDLPKPRASSPDWCANPPGDRRECGRPPTCSELACCGRPRPRVVIVVPARGSGFLLVSAIVVPTPPRVVIVVPARGSGNLLVSAIVVQTVGLADWVGLPNPHSCRYCGTNPGFDFLLESLSWFKPGERLSVATRWMCQYPYGKNTGAGRGSNPGEKATCRNSRTARNDSDELGLDPV